MKKHNRRYKDSVFVDFFSEDKTAIDKEHGFEAAIKECIHNNILKDYLFDIDKIAEGTGLSREEIEKL